MSCGCPTNRCTCTTCDPANEPLSSALNNFIAAFFGSLTKSCVNGQVVWALPCNLESGSSLLPRNAGEGIACYLLRVFEFIQLETCQDFQRIFINGLCYDTWQSAYDANEGATGPTLMLVGQGDFGDLDLTSDYNSNIVTFGLGSGSSRLGNVTTNQFDFVAEAHKIAINSIDTRIAGIGGAIVTLSGEGSAGIINNSRNDATSGSVGTITATNWQIASIDNSHSVGTGAAGNVVLSRCICGPINTSAVGDSPGGVTLRQCPQIGTITSTGGVGSTTNVIIAEESNIVAGSGLNAITEINGSSSFINCKLKTVDSNMDAIANVNSDGAQFLNTVIVPHGAGDPIDSTVARTIIAYNLLTKNALSANVNLSEGNSTSSPNLRYP